MPKKPQKPKTTPKPPPSATERARRCEAKVKAACIEENCRLVPYITTPEPVGHDGEKVQMSAALSIVANPD